MSVTTALIYTRVSTEEQAREGLSLEAQLAECRRYAAARGWAIGRDDYCDVQSGRRDDRPHYQRLLADVRAARAAGRSVVVLVAALDRFGRRLLERVRARDELKRLGVAVHSVRDGGEVSDLVSNILASVAEEESRRLGERVAAAKRHAGAQGWHEWGWPPWGYRWRPATAEERGQGSPRSVLEFDPLAAPYVRQLFERVAGGTSARKAAEWVATLPEWARGGRRLAWPVVRRILASPVYLAAPPARWPPLVEPALFGEVQRRIRGHQVHPHQATGHFLLTGFLRCPRCGGRMCGRSAWGRPSYQCTGDVRGAGAPVLLCRWFAGTALVDPLVREPVGALLGAVLRIDDRLQRRLEQAWERLRHPEAGRGEGRRAAAERAAAQARERLRVAALRFVDGELDRAGYELVRERAEADLDAAGLELAAVVEPEPGAHLPPLGKVLGRAEGWVADWRSASLAEQRAVLAELVDVVVPARVGAARGPGVRYEVAIGWTALGEALREVVGGASRELVG